MGKHGEKKAAKEAALLKKSYSIAFVAISIIYCVLRLLSSNKITLDTLLPLLWFTLVSYKMIEGIVTNALQTISYTVYQDIIIVNWIVQILWVFSSWFAIIYLLIPVYALWTHRIMISHLVQFGISKIMS